MNRFVVGIIFLIFVNSCAEGDSLMEGLGSGSGAITIETAAEISEKYPNITLAGVGGERNYRLLIIRVF